MNNFDKHFRTAFEFGRRLRAACEDYAKLEKLIRDGSIRIAFWPDGSLVPSFPGITEDDILVTWKFPAWPKDEIATTYFQRLTAWLTYALIQRERAKKAASARGSESFAAAGKKGAEARWGKKDNKKGDL